MMNKVRQIKQKYMCYSIYMEQTDAMEIVPTTETAPVTISPLRTQYNEWLTSIEDIQKDYPGIITDVISPDTLNRDLALEDIDRRWEVLQGSADPSILDFYEDFRDYLAMPRILDTFVDTEDGHNMRRDFRRKISTEHPNYYDIFKKNDIRLGPISAIIGLVELYGMVIDDEKIFEKHGVIFKELIDPNDPNSREIYSNLSKDKKITIAGQVRGLARELYFSDP